MSLAIRITLLVVALISMGFVLNSIRKSKMRIEDTIFWAALAFLVLLLSIFPQIGSWFSRLLGFQAPVNFIFLFFIFVLLMKCFSLSRQISEQEIKIKELVQHVAIDQFNRQEHTRDTVAARRTIERRSASAVSQDAAGVDGHDEYRAR